MDLMAGAGLPMSSVLKGRRHCASEGSWLASVEVCACAHEHMCACVFVLCECVCVCTHLYICLRANIFHECCGLNIKGILQTHSLNTWSQLVGLLLFGGVYGTLRRQSLAGGGESLGDRLMDCRPALLLVQSLLCFLV